MKRNFVTNRYYVKPSTIIDVSSIIVIPDDWDAIRDIIDLKTSMPCMLYHPKNMSFFEVRGIRVKIQDSFPNIRDNKMHAWSCTNFFKIVFSQLRGKMDMRVVGRTFQGELLVRLYTIDIEKAKQLGLIYLSGNCDDVRGCNQYKDYINLVTYQMNTFGQVCVNDIMNMYSQYVIRGVVNDNVHMDE